MRALLCPEFQFSLEPSSSIFTQPAFREILKLLLIYVHSARKCSSYISIMVIINKYIINKYLRFYNGRIYEYTHVLITSRLQHNNGSHCDEKSLYSDSSLLSSHLKINCLSCFQIH